MKKVRILVLNLVDLPSQSGRIVNTVFATRDFFLGEGFDATIPNKGNSAVSVIDLSQKPGGPVFDDYFTPEKIEFLVETRNIVINTDGVVYAAKPEACLF